VTFTHTRDSLLDAAVPLAVEHGYRNVSRRMLAEAAGCSESLPAYYWRPISMLHGAILVRALRGAETGDGDSYIILGQALAAKDPLALAAPAAVRAEAARRLAGL
jgi:AcrR family transcriptional regulator